MKTLEEYAPNERKVVYFIDDIDYNNLGYKEEGKELLTNPELLLVPLKRTEEFLDNYTIIEDIQPYNGMMLTISPYDRTKYSEVVKANENFAVEKLANILRICHLIGAKSVKTEKVFAAKHSTEGSAHLGGNIKAFSGSSDAKSTYLNEMVSKLKYDATYSGGQCDYEAAKRYLRKSRLSGDRFLEELVEMANASNNKLQRISQEISLSSNMESTNELLLKISFPVAGGKFQLNKKTASEEKYYLTIEIEF